MTTRDEGRRGRSVPSRRLSRLGQFGRLAGGLAGGMLAEGARRLAEGERPAMRDMLLTPGNLLRVADRLSHLRGAAMKLGQMISLDAGDALPAELSELLARLRADADPMPPLQLQRVLAAEWGREWRNRFKSFDDRPIAAASIGQVHRAVTLDGRELAIKIQYPGVRASIDADVDNVATLLRVSGLLPPGLPIAPLLAEAKAQLHEEADYRREGAELEAYGRLMAGNEDFVVPELAPDFTTENILAMSFVEGVPIEAMANGPQHDRDRVTALLIDLVLDEIFRFGVMQTDPNFANFRYQPLSGRIVLLDFGATRPVPPATAEAYRRLLAAGLASDAKAVKTAALDAGLLGEAALRRHGELIERVISLIVTEASRSGPFDFADRRVASIVRDQAASVASDREAWHIPPTDMLFVQRKISGIALLAARLRARVDVRSMVAERIGATPSGL
ncbi:MAG: AarF/ABC1/UbiB kinase family protein [Fulvimarina manganoxydans]|uniref:ABC1 kinase family protein n=1 Tax=Fulvimarina manganoxydans TaxID=937218 RepID=UPI0023553850|nr:AarF/ABC1/UbiB kinase family protein [Fulvimarina manganoxydans]MCK5933812.1 AarF/ABC1/UbiB kinase family protein [Fulvimarina manganoxydans]